MSFVGDIVGGFFQDRAAKRADNTMREATAAEIAENRRQYDTTREDFAPWRETGKNALQKLAMEIERPTTAADVMADPGYQFGLDEGQKAISRRIAAGGGRVSGPAIKAAGRFGVDYATTGYGAADTRRENRLTRLAQLGQLGSAATSDTSRAGMFATDNIGRAYSNQGEATARSQLERGNIWADTLNKVVSGAKRGGASYFGFGD